MIVKLFFICVLSLWDYPARQPRHEQLKSEFIAAMRVGDTAKMISTSQQGAKLFPQDPTWAFNKACSLAYKKDQESAYIALEKAIDLGFRDVNAIKNDSDLKRLRDKVRFNELLEYAESKKGSLILVGPLASVPSMASVGSEVIVGAQNLGWDFENGCYEVKVKLSGGSYGGNNYDLYMNRDGFHSKIDKTKFPGLSEVKLDLEGQKRGAALDFPNMKFPYPVFGNCSRALVMPKFWRSLPRALTTINSNKLPLMERFYLSNQFWVYPANADYPPVGTNGNCFLSVTPYWIVTQGASWTDKYYLSAALEISRSLKPEVKMSAVNKGLLPALVQMIIRRSLNSVSNENDYFTGAAHPTCFPPQGLNIEKMKSLAGSIADVPPVATLALSLKRRDTEMKCLYANRLSAAFILPDKDSSEELYVQATGGDEIRFEVVHGDVNKVQILKINDNVAKVTVNSKGLTSRIDIAVFAKNKTSTWGAPSFVCFARKTNMSGYTDPFFLPAEKSPTQFGEKQATTHK